MINHDILPRGNCMLSCRVIENYDVLGTIADVFDKYPVADLREDFGTMFKWALLDKDNYSKRDAAGNLICLYENVDYAIIGLHSFATENGLLPPGNSQGQKRLSDIKYVDPETKANVKCINVFEPYELRSVLWQMFQSAICENTMGQTDDDKRDLINTFEAVSDLAAAAYILAKEYSKKEG